MAIIYSYPTVIPNVNDLVLGTDVSGAGKPTKNFTVQSLVDLVAGGAAGLGAVLTIGNDAKNAQGVNQSAINLNNVQGTGTFTAGSFADGTMNITGGVGAGFTSFESTSFTGKLDAASFNQSNIRTLGILTDLKVGNATPAVTSIATTFTNPGTDLALATTKAIVDYIATTPNPESLAQTLENGNTTADAAFPQGNDIIISGRGDGAAGNKLIFNSAQTLIEFKNNNFLGATITKPQNGNVTFTSSVNSGGYEFKGDEFRVLASVTPAETMLLAEENAGVKLFHNGTEKFDTTSTGITVLGAVLAAVGTKELPSYIFTGDVDTGMFHPAANEIGFSTEEVLRLKISNSGIDVTGVIDATGLIEGLSFTTDTTLSKTPMTRFVKSTDPSNPVTNPVTAGISAANLQVDTMVPTVLAVKNYADKVAGAKTLSYQADAATDGGTMPFTMNLSTDDLDIAGGSNINTSTLAVTAGADPKAVITINLDDNVTISGTSKAGTFTTTAGTATWVTTVLAGFTKITSALFVGDSTASLVAPVPPNAAGTPNNVQFQGNASSANRLGPSDGTIQLSAGSGATLGVSSGTVKYTNGGVIELTTSLLNTTVTAKTLQGLPTPAAATVVAGDTILQGFGKLQSQINGIADGLQFQGTWNANINEGGAGAAPNGTPALTSGGGEASSGTTDATTANELVDSTKNFTTAPNIVVVGDKVINQADGQTALVTSIANAASGRLGIGADIMLTAEAYIIDKSPFITAGHYYVVNAVGAGETDNATLNGIQDWQIGDWVIASTTNVWQKLNNSAVEGSGTQNRLPKWTAAVSTLIDSGIIDNGTTIKLENDTELGAAAGDAIKSVGVLTADEQLILKKGLGVGSTPNYGSTNQVLTSGNGSDNPPTWTTPTTGTVTTVSASTTGDALDVAVTTPTTTPAIALTWAGAASQYVNGLGNLITFPTVDNYVSWTADSDEGTDIAITSGFNLKFTGAVTSGGAGIATDSAVSANEMTIGLINAGGTPSATSFYRGDGQWAVPVGTKTETLAEVLSNGNTSGTNDIVMADDQKVTFGTVPDLQIYHDTAGGNSHIQTTSGSAGDLLIQSQGTGHDLYLRATDDIYIQPQGSENGIYVEGEGTVKLYHNSIEKLATTSTGVGVTGVGVFSGNVGVGNAGTFDNPNSYAPVIEIAAAGPVGLILNDTRDTNPMSIDNTGAVMNLRYNTTSMLALDGATSKATFTGDVEIDGNLTVDGSIIHGGGGAGIFTGSKAINSSTNVTVFTLQRSTGTLIFDVWLTSETSTATSVAKKYTVAHSYGTDPVYNKIIDTGPDGSNDFTVTFVNAGTGGNSVNCSIISNTIAAQTIGYTVQVGHDSTNTLTFTAG